MIDLATRRAVAIQRLADSRAEFRCTLIRPEAEAAHGPMITLRRLRALWRLLRRTWRGSPLVEELQLQVRANPAAAVAVAAALGLALAASRPWRWLRLPSMAFLIEQIGPVQGQVLLGSLLALLARRERP